MAKVLVDENDCWLWQASLLHNGYAQFNTRGPSHLAHRWSYEHFIGLIPQGFVLDHLCRVRHCVNPHHLEAVTQRENLLRGDGFIGRQARQTHCVHGHEYTPENTIRDGNKRRCHTCYLVTQRRIHKARRQRGLGKAA